MPKLLGIDIGTSATKVLLIDEKGQTIKSASRSYELSTPNSNWAEQDPRLWINAMFECIAEIGEKNPDAIGLTGQMHGMVALDQHDQPIRPAILWCDQRTEKECQEIDQVLGKEQVRATTCNPPMTGFQVPKLLWLKRHEPEHFEATKSVLLPKDFAKLILTGEKSSDVSDASGTGLFDVPQRQWWQEGMQKLGLQKELFPPVYESQAVSSRTLKSDVLNAGIPVVAGAGDQAAGAVGTGAISKGVMSLSLGTSGVVFATIDRPIPDSAESLNVFCHANNGWHAMGVMLSCGGAVNWAKNIFFPNATFAEFDDLARKSEVGCNGLTFLPYLAGERCPHNDPFASGAFAGLSLSHQPRDLARAVLEGVTFGIKGCFDRIGGSSSLRVTGGGAKSAFWLQMIADACQVECVPIQSDQGPAFGAAILAGVGIGVWPDLQTATNSTIRLGAAVQPQPVDYRLSYERYKNLYPTLKVWKSESIGLQ